ncbi:hypothetical protein UB23_18700 [Pseudomonas sp. ES3-33]|nr:hypothetical protein UB23_18700 [Pseudomonas sp. ES3-33]
MIITTAARAIRVSSGSGKKGGQKSQQTMRSSAAEEALLSIHMVCDTNGVPLRFWRLRYKPEIYRMLRCFWIRFVSPVCRGGIASAVLLTIH